MTRIGTMPDDAARGLLAPRMADGEIYLLTLTSEQWAGPMRFCSAAMQRLEGTDETGRPSYGLISRGETFVYIPFAISWPNDDAEAPRATLSMDGVTRAVTPHLRALSGPVDALLEIVLSGDLEHPLAVYPGLELVNYGITAQRYQSELSMDTLTSESCPAHGYTPAGFAGLF